ncbi:MAG: D-alanyl-D-alanine carboxypeptidase family protein [Rhodospirillaceae bacterium]
MISLVFISFCRFVTRQVPLRLCKLAGPLAPFAVALLAAFMVTGPAEAAHYTSIVLDAGSGAVLHNDGADVRNYPASLTKMMTLYLTFEALDSKKLKLDQELPVSRHAEKQAPSKLGLRNGDTIKVEHAVLAVVTKSANDMAVVLAEALGGSEAAFAVLMTAKARSLGMSHTQFRNASGLPNDQQVTTARDLSTLSLALIHDWPQFYRYFSRTTFSYNGHTMANHNHLMSRYPGMDGIKTGFINKSGFNLAASVVRNGRRLVAVVMGGPSARARDNYMASLLDTTFRRIDSGKAGQEAAIPRVNPAPAPEALADAGPVVGNNSFVGNNDTAGDRDDEHDQPSAQPIKVSAKAGAAMTKAAGHGAWNVQLGTFKTKAAASHAINQASHHMPAGVGRIGTSLHKAKHQRSQVFRAGLTGFKNEKTARLVCAKVKIKGHNCTVAPQIRARN